MKLHIFYRHYNVSGTEERRPDDFDYERCFDNLLDTIEGNKDVELHIIYDESKLGDNWIFDFKEKYLNKLIKVNGGGDFKAFQQLQPYIDSLNLEKDDLIYFLENDYLHVHGWADKVIELFKTYNGLNYVSLYDHPDKYFLPQYENLVSKIIITKTHHWRTTPSTCGSFVITKEFYDQDKDILFTMEGDHNKFLWLAEHRQRFVLTPIPSLSTHMMKGLEAPTIEW